MPNIELKQCPFCGCEKPYMNKNVGMYIWFFVQCPKCSAKSAEKRISTEAAEAWNRRANDEEP